MKVHFGSQSLLKKSTVLFILFLVLLSFCMSIQSAFATETTYSVQIWLENADDNNYTLMERKTVVTGADANAALPEEKLNEIVEAAKKAVIKKTTGVAEPADINMRGTGFHLRGEGEQITGYAPNESTISPYSEEGQSAFEYGYFDDEEGEMDADDDKIRKDGKTVIKVFFNRDRYGVYLRVGGKCDLNGCPFYEWNKGWVKNESTDTGDSDDNYKTLPADPFIVKNGASLYKRFYDDSSIGDLFKHFTATWHSSSSNDPGWTWWARWELPDSTDGYSTYQVDLSHSPENNHNAYDVMEGPAFGLQDGAETFKINENKINEKVQHIVLQLQKAEVHTYKTTYQYFKDGTYKTPADEEEVVYGYYYGKGIFDPSDPSTFKGFSRDLWLDKVINGYIIENKTVNDKPIKAVENDSIINKIDPKKIFGNETGPRLMRYYIDYDNEPYTPLIIRQYLTKHDVEYYPGPKQYDTADVTARIPFGDSISGTQPKKEDKTTDKYIENDTTTNCGNLKCRFMGWYEDPEYIQKANLDQTMPDFDLKFYGKWEIIPTEFSFTKIWDGVGKLTDYLPKDPDQMIKGLTLHAQPQSGAGFSKISITSEDFTYTRPDKPDETVDGSVWTYTLSPKSSVKPEKKELISGVIITVSERTPGDTTWDVVISKLPAYYTGIAVKYTVEEKIKDYFTWVGNNYSVQVAENKQTITNFKNLMTISGEKSWDHKSEDGQENPVENRPESVTIHLHKGELTDNDDSVFRYATASEGSGWKFTFENIPVFENGQEIQYTVHEESIDDYHTVVPDNGKYNITIRKTGKTDCNFKNKYTPGYKDITVKKEWRDNHNRDGIQPAEVEVTLLADGNMYIDTYNPDANPVKLTAENDWEYTFNSVPIYDGTEKIKYTVKETFTDVLTEDTDGPGTYRLEEIAGNDSTGFMIINRHTPQTVTLEIEKIWRDEGYAETYRPDPEAFLNDLALYETYEKDGETKTIEYRFSSLEKVSEQAGTYKFRADARAGKINFTVTVNAGDDPNAWKVTVSGLPKDFEGKEIAWSLNEFVDYYLDEIEGDGTSFIAVNTLGLTEVTVRKIWVDNNSSKRPDPKTFLESMWLTSGDLLFTPGTLTGGKQDDGTYFYRSDTYPTVTARLEILSDDEWTVTIAGLPKILDGVEMEWQIHENPKNGYKASISGDQESGFTITNTLQREKIDIEVVKFWNDSGYDNVEHPEFTLRLYANDVEIQNTKIPAGTKETWKWQVSGLDKYDESGNVIIYSISEDPVEHFQAIIDEKTMEITNVFIPEQTEVHVEKRWNGENHPESVVVKLLADGEEVRTAELSSPVNGWKYTFKSLPVYSKTDPTRRIEYTIEELSVPGWETSISGNAASGFVITNDPENIPPVPPRPSFFLLDLELPLTGITGLTNTDMKASVKYTPVDMELQIPMLDVTSKIVSVEPDADGVYPVTWLGMDAGLLSGTSLPGEGISVIAAHNTLNAEEYGPFALIATLAEGDRFFISREDEGLMVFEVYANEKIGASDVDELYQTASLYGSTVTLLTCEDERPEGGYASRRIVSAREVRF